jgi:alcohol dehydrogenase class IV
MLKKQLIGLNEHSSFKDGELSKIEAVDDSNGTKSDFVICDPHIDNQDNISKSLDTLDMQNDDKGTRNI